MYFIDFDMGGGPLVPLCLFFFILMFLSRHSRVGACRIVRARDIVHAAVGATKEVFLNFDHIDYIDFVHLMGGRWY